MLSGSLLLDKVEVDPEAVIQQITTQRSCYALNYNLIMTTETDPDIKLHPADCLNAHHTA